MKSEEEVRKLLDSRMRIYSTLQKASQAEQDGVLVIIKMCCEVEARLLCNILQISIPPQFAIKDLVAKGLGEGVDKK